MQRSGERRRALERAVFLGADHFMVVTDADGVIVDMNPAAERDLGYAREELIGRARPNIFHDRDEIAAYAAERGFPVGGTKEGRLAYLRAMRGQREWTFVRKDGSRFPALLTITSLFDDDGSLLGFLGVGQDLTERKALEAKAHRATQRLAAAMDAMSEGFMLFDAAERIVVCSERAKQLYPLVADLMVPGARFEDVLRAGVARGQYDLGGMTGEEWIADRLTRHRNPGPPFEQQLADGRWLQISECRLDDGGTVGLRTDITRLKRSEEALRAAAEFRAAMLAAAPLAIISSDRNGRIILWEGAAEALFGWRSDEVLGRSNPIVPADMWDEYMAAIDTQIHQGRSLHGVETVRRRKDGSLVEVSISTAPLYDGTGETIGVIGVIADITERRRAQAAEREYQDRLRVALEGADLGTWHYDPSTDIVNWDERTRRLFGSDHEAIPYEEVMDLIHPDDRDCVREAVENAQDAEGDGWFQAEYRVVRKDGSQRWVMARGRAFFAEKGERGLVRFIGTVADVTERRAAEERQARARKALETAQRMEALGQLAAGMAHEMNNALTPIIGLTEIAIQDVAPEHAEGLRTVLTAAKRATETVKRVLAFGRQAGSPPGPHDLRAALEEANRLVRTALPGSVTIKAALGDAALWTPCDPSEVQQVMLNLASNAAAALNGRHGRLSVRLDGVDIAQGAGLLPAGRYARLEVTDDGEGMDAQTQARVFEPFFTTKAVGEGSGLGLAVVHGIVSGHGGAVTVDSAPGRGATFAILLPALDPPVPREPAQPASESQGNSSHTP